MSVETSISNNVAEIILDCPPVNALTSTEWLDLAINIDNLAHNNDVKVNNYKIFTNNTAFYNFYRKF